MPKIPGMFRHIVSAQNVGTRRHQSYQTIPYAEKRSIVRLTGLRDDGPDFALLHGGGWFAGNPWDNEHWIDYLRPHARSINLIEYGVATPHRSDIEGSFRDARAAIRWITDQPVSRAAVVLIGFSAGAAMAIDLALTMDPSYLAGLLLFSPVTDLSTSGFVNKMTGDAGHQHLSPVHRLRDHPARLICPCLIFHGINDKTVPVAASRHFSAVWRETQAGPCDLVEVAACGHGLDKTPAGFARCCAELDAHFFATEP